MKELSDYNEQDYSNVIDEAKMISMMCIHSVYKDLMEEDKVCCEDMHKVKEAIKTMYYIHHIEHNK